MKTILRALISSLLLISLSVSSWAETQGQQAFKVVENMISLIRSEFIEDAAPSVLLKGAFGHLKTSLAERSLAYTAPTYDETIGLAEAQALLSEEFERLSELHPEILERNWLSHAVIEGMIKGLDDRYTVFLDPEEYQRLRESMAGGDFGGVGIYIELSERNSGRLTVARPIPDSPASRAGITTGDVILAIDGDSTQGFTIEDAQQRLRGPVGSPVTLTIRRLNQELPFDVVLGRDQIRVSSVTSTLEEEDGYKIGYIRLQMFGEKTDQEMEAALRLLEAQGAEGYLLDLRNNGGGYIISAVDVVSKFLPTGSVVTSVEERGTGNRIYRSRPSLRAPKPLVLLINQYSASASEITAAALADYERAKLVGVKSFGKGSVQKIFSLPDGSGVKITTAHYRTPKGEDIDEVGIEPGQKVEYEGTASGKEQDTQYRAALSSLVEQLKEQRTLAESSTYPVARTGVEQWRYLNSLGRGQPRLLERRYLKEGEDAFFEEIRVVFPDTHRPETFRFDLGPALGLSS